MTRWINVYPHCYSAPHRSRDEADMCANGRRLYCIKVTLK